MASCAQCHAAFEPAREGDILCPACVDSRVVRQAATVPYSPTTDVPRLSPEGAGPQPQSLRDDEVLSPGTILGQYRLEGFIGRGGMGAVYKARHTLLDRTVALKVLPAKLSADPEFIHRFRREALALANLSHPNIVAIHDMGMQGQIHFFVMEHVDGVNLRDLLQSRKMPPEQALRLVPQLCDALEYAHSKGIIHRDIKPANILIDRNGSAKVADFGLAKILGAERPTAAVTQTNVVMGTVEYMAPEQRDSLKDVDHRADIYSMGVVLYELLTGELPVGKFDLPSRRVQVHVQIDDVVLKALEKDPEQRYQRASHMGTDVGRVISAPVPVRDLPVRDLKSGKAIGTAAGGRLAVRAKEADVTVHGWSRDEVGIEGDGAFRLREQSPAVLVEADGETGTLDLYVPRGAEIDLGVHEGSLTLKSVAGAVKAQLHEGNFAATQHDGPLSLQCESGEATVDGIRTESLDLTVAEGSVAVSGLDLRRGRARIESSDGDVSVSVTPESSFRFELEGGAVTSPGDARSGQVGGGAASLQVRAKDIHLRVGAAPPMTLASIGSLLRNLPPKQVERIGVYAIVCAAIFLFSFFVAKTMALFVCVAVFWGMAIALDLWKGMLRGTTQVVAAPRPPAPVAAEPPPAPKPRTSWLAVLGLFVSVGALAVSGAAAIAVELERNAEVGRLDPQSIVVARLTAFTCGVAGAGLAVLALAFFLAGGRHLREAKGGLRGRPAVAITFLFAVASLVVGGWIVRPHLARVQREAGEARQSAEIFLQSLRERDFAGAREGMTSALRARVPEPEMAALVGKGLDRHPERWRTIRADRAEVAAGLRAAQVRFSAGREGSWVALEREDEAWRVSDPGALLRQLGVAER